MELDLKHIRGKLDAIDDALVSLFAQRMRLVTQVAAYKKEHHLPIQDTGREDQIIERVSQAVEPELAPYAGVLFQTLFSVSKDYQAKRLGSGEGPMP